MCVRKRETGLIMCKEASGNKSKMSESPSIMLFCFSGFFLFHPPSDSLFIFPTPLRLRVIPPINISMMCFKSISLPPPPPPQETAAYLFKRIPTQNNCVPCDTSIITSHNMFASLSLRSTRYKKKNKKTKTRALTA